jgi:hypothetical protein
MRSAIPQIDKNSNEPFFLSKKAHSKSDGSLFHNETPQRLIVLLFFCMSARGTHRRSVIILHNQLFLIAFSLDIPRVDA